MTIRAIALNTWRETVRDRFMIAVVALIVLIMATAVLVEGQGPTRAAAVLDLGLSASGALGTLVAIFLGTSLVHKEMDKRTLYVVLTKPVTRFQFLAGKFTGLMATLTVLVLAVAGSLGGMMAVLGRFDAQVFALLGSLWMQLALVTAIAFCFATITSGILSALYTGGLYLFGLQTELIREFAESEVKLNAANYAVGHLLYWVLPNFTVFDFKNAVVYGGALPWAAWGWGLAYGAMMSAALLMLAAFAWERRELP